jgi:hypothetical protein
MLQVVREALTPQECDAIAASCARVPDGAADPDEASKKDKEAVRSEVSYHKTSTANLIHAFLGNVPVGVVLVGAGGMTLYKFKYDASDAKTVGFIKDKVLDCRDGEHAVHEMAPFMRSEYLAQCKEEMDLYALSLSRRGTTLKLDVEHGELRRLCIAMSSDFSGTAVLLAKNSQMSLVCDVNKGLLRCKLLDAQGSFLASASHDWFHFSDMLSLSATNVDNVQGLLGVLQQQTRMLRPKGIIRSETDNVYEMYRNTDNKLATGVSIIRSLGLVYTKKNTGSTHKGFATKTEHRNFVSQNCLKPSSDVDRIGGAFESVNLKRSTSQALPNTPVKISCNFSSTLRYAIAHQNKELSDVLTMQFHQNLEQVSSTLLSGIACCVSNKVPLGGFAQPCKMAILANASDFNTSEHHNIELRRMNVCRHAMGTNQHTIKLNQNYSVSDIWVHVCDNGSCVFSVHTERNLVCVHLSSVSTVQPFAPRYKASVLRDRSTGSVFKTDIGPEVRNCTTFSLRRAAVELAHINTACVQNPGTSLQHEHRFLRSCWFSANIDKLAEMYPSRSSDAEYCAYASQLSNMAKAPLSSCNYWCTVPFCDK